MRFSDDPENWMGNLPEELRERTSVIHLAIPGSHDSASYGIKRQSKIAPDAETVVKTIYPFVPCIVRRWARTQKFSLEKQLINGIRYFDLRVAVNDKKNKEIYFTHGLFCDKIDSLLDVNQFLDDHPNELVILDFQHFYNFSDEDHGYLKSNIVKVFDRKLLRSSETGIDRIFLKTSCDNGRQCICIYRDQQRDSGIFYSPNDFPTPWPQATKVDDLKNFLEHRIQFRRRSQGYCTQILLTPDSSFIIRRFYSSLKSSCAKKVEKEMLSWIQEQTPGDFAEGDAPKINVMLVDFTDLDNNNLTKTIIDLNMKLIVS